MINLISEALEISSRKVKLILYTLLIFVSATLFPSIYLYSVHFKLTKITNDITLWGYFGEFWGNIIISLTSILNLIAFIFISIIVAKMGKRQSEFNIKNQVLLNTSSIKMDSIKELQKSTSNFIEICKISDINKRNNSFSVIQEFLNSFQKSHISILFENGEENIIELINLLHELKNKVTDDEIILFIDKRDELIKILIKEVYSQISKKDEKK